MDKSTVAKPRGTAAKSKPRLQPDDSASLGDPRGVLEVAECWEGGPSQKQMRLIPVR